MSFILDTTSRSGFTPVPTGIHTAICRYVVDIGKQGGKYGLKPTILLGFEIPGLTGPDGLPLQISRRFGKSLAEKSALRPFLSAWLQGLPPQLDLSKLAGMGITLIVAQVTGTDGRTFSNITSCTPLQPGQTLPAPSVPPICYGPDKNPAAFAALPEWLQKLVINGDAAPVGTTAPLPAYTPAAPMPTATAFAPQTAPMAPAYPSPPAAPAYPQAPQTAPTAVNAGIPFDDNLNF